LCLTIEFRTIADFIAPIGYCQSMSKTSSEERKARDAAFDELLASINPEFALRKEMAQPRQRAGLSQMELARRMRTTQSTIARLERGGRSPSVKTLRKLAEATGSRLVVRLDAGDVSFERKRDDDV
jgi:ribosome-binding protein aMBF1 (putative translation factor)